MTIRLNKILVLDLELSCWRDKVPPPGEEQEIIEIGVALYDVTARQPISRRSFPVRPARSRISEFCTELTGWTWDRLKSAPPLEGALNQLVEAYGPKNKVWASWGSGDRVCLERTCRELGLRYPFSHRHINLKTQFGLVMGLKEEVGLAKALTMVGVESEGEAHRGDWDAWNTARLIPFLYPERGLGV